jgi:predicted transcriptional regulator
MSEQSPPPTAKERVAAILNRLPDDSTIDQILQEIAFVRMVDRGVRDAEAGRVVSHEEVVRDSKSWSK